MTTLLLDIDGVLQFPHPNFAATIHRDYHWSSDYDAFLDDLFRDPEYLATLEGIEEITPILERILPRHVTGLTGTVFLRRWLAESTAPNDRLLSLLPRLRADGIYLASNQEPLRAAHIQESYRHHRWLTGLILSHQVGHRKPQTAYFHQLLRIIDRAAEQCLFIDDSRECVAAAQHLGIPSIRFTTTDHLIPELSKHGVDLKEGPQLG